MATYYVGSGGNNGNAGTSWAQRKLTLNGAEDIPVVAGDTVYVGPGTYRELLTVDVSATVGNPITYIGDYTGANTDGTGGLVRITGSDNDQSATRASCISAATQKDYRTFRGFLMDTTTGNVIVQTGGVGWNIENCLFYPGSATTIRAVAISGATQATNTISNCAFLGGGNSIGVGLTHGSALDNTGHVIQNCIFIGGEYGVRDDRIGGVTIKNSAFLTCMVGVRVATALTAAQTLTVNNSVIQGCVTGLQATTTAEFVEDYNTLFGNTGARTNVTAGSNSLAYPVLLDPRWFFQMIYGGAGPSDATQVITPFDLASFSQIINVAGTSPTTTDMRGTSAQGGQREWGALEYDSTLKIEGAAAGAAGGSPVVGSFIVR